MDVARFEEIEVGDVGVGTLELANVLDLLKLGNNEGVVGIALAVDESQDGVAVLPAVLASQPTRRFGEESHHATKEDGGDHLEGPRDTPRGSLVAEGIVLTDERASVRHVVHDQDTPGDGPLLETDEATTLRGRRDFGDVDGDLGRLDTDAETVDHAANAEHGNILRGGADGGTDEPVGLVVSDCLWND